MVKRLLFLVLIFYALVLLQTGFFIPFGEINLILLLTIFLNIFEKSEGTIGLSSSIIAGFFLDTFSNKPFGFYLFFLVALSLLIKLILKRYIQFPVLIK